MHADLRRDALRERIEREMYYAAVADEDGPMFAPVELRTAVKVAERLVLEYEGMGDAVDVYRERAEAAEKEHRKIELLLASQVDEARRALAEMREKWGHVEACGCHNRRMSACVEIPCGAPFCKEGEVYAHDPRCALVGGGE